MTKLLPSGRSNPEAAKQRVRRESGDSSRGDSLDTVSPP
jgi:hypothetical protein